ncbi:MAG: FtsX-like permease family protein [Planctomycetaceae bacterium]
MYKLLLSGRYLRTRFIALASIISVTLGVATMIVVNSVMSGFSTQMKDRIHGILSDIVVESISTDGEPDPAGEMARIQSLIGEHVVAMTPTVEIYGLLTFEHAGEHFHRPVTIIGIDPEGKNAVSPMSSYLQTRQTGERSLDEPLDWELTTAAEQHRARFLELERFKVEAMLQSAGPDAGHIEDPFAPTGTVAAPEVAAPPSDAPLQGRVYIGASLVSFPFTDSNGETQIWSMVDPGTDVSLSTLKAGTPEICRFPVTVVDVFQSGMSEYDSQIVFCNLEALQAMRGMMVQAPGSLAAAQSSPDLTGSTTLDWRDGSFTSIQIKLTDYANAPIVMDILRRELDPRKFQIRTWEQKQGPLLEAVAVESAILNVLLFLIIAVAGFGILAIFYMIVVEKTRDIGILKALGASSQGVMSIFLSYGLSLGVVGSGAGVVLGLTIVYYINEIEDGISALTGQKVFDETIYYFKEIPTSVSPWMVLSVAGGAIAIAVLASVLPARRAARLHPVQALRYE